MLLLTKGLLDLRAWCSTGDMMLAFCWWPCPFCVCLWVSFKGCSSVSPGFSLGDAHRTETACSEDPGGFVRVCQVLFWMVIQVGMYLSAALPTECIVLPCASVTVQSWWHLVAVFWLQVVYQVPACQTLFPTWTITLHPRLQEDFRQE